MNGLDDVPDQIYRLIFFGVIFYFALLLYGQATGDTLALLASEFVFGVIAVGVGTVLFFQPDTDDSRTLLGAAACLIVGGALQFAYLFTRIPSLDAASSLVVFVGIGLYIYEVWYSA